MLYLREISAEARLPVASAYADNRGYIPPSPHGESSEGTDSGITINSNSGWEAMDVQKSNRRERI